MRDSGEQEQASFWFHVFKGDPFLRQFFGKLNLAWGVNAMQTKDFHTVFKRAGGVESAAIKAEERNKENGQAGVFTSKASHAIAPSYHDREASVSVS